MNISIRLSGLMKWWAGADKTWRRDRVHYGPVGEALEPKALPSQGPVWGAILGQPQGEVRWLTVSTDVNRLKAAEVTSLTRVLAASTSPCVGGTRDSSLVRGENSLTKEVVANPVGSGKVDPKDPGGVELIQTADPGKIDPKDPGGVELVRTTASVKLDPNDAGGVELDWVDHAAVDRLSRS
jgi:hypothetical protein